MLYAVIMAGGKGTRFWPLSREARPKQLLPIVGERTMIQTTVERIAPLIPPERILVVTGAAHAREIKTQLPGVPEENIIVEPAGRNTAPCVALASMIVEKRDPDAVMAVLPSDHVITRPEALRETMTRIVNALDDYPDHLATIGITPSFPETGYGYIEQGEPMANGLYRVKTFLEKPDRATAEGYAASGSFHWNSGMFFWKASAILTQLRKHMPTLMEDMTPIEAEVDGHCFGAVMERVYPELESISIDYAIMEKAAAEGEVMVAPADPGWSDVGSWRALYGLIEPGDDGNRNRGEMVAIDATGVVTHNEKRLVAVIGVDDVIVIETDDAILVCHKDHAQDVRRVIEELKKRGLGHLL